MLKPRSTRRAFLRGAGGVAIALPWLEFFQGAPVRAQAAPASRFLTVFQPGGTVLNKWRPTGTETAPVLSPILAPLEPMKQKLLVLDGLDMKSAIGGIHEEGIVALLTGTPQSDKNRRFASGPSIDQVLADRLMKPRRSLELAIRWATGKAHGLLATNNCLNFENAQGNKPIPPRLDPVEIWNGLFKTTADPAQGNDAKARLARKRSILDYLDRRYAGLAQRLGTEDRAKLEQHLTKIREIERTLGELPTTSMCKAPELVDTRKYNPFTGRNSADDGSIKDSATDAEIPKVGKLMMDMLVMAFACDMTAVGTLQWTDTEAKHTFPWLNLSEHHHYYQHDGGFKPAECQKICTWYSEMHLYLLQAMAAVDMGGHTLLDESVVFFGSELQEPPSHKTNNLPILLAGGGGGLRTGRWLRYNALSHNNLLVSILNLFGDTRRTFGDPKYCDGPLTNLT
ncbi:MAG TPA: DUF1552 domain-containing protein [Polyangiales bacterium]|nr:DUF1552 domain-containing protein [Polyangiales bacterium]